jgi:hypothetical protein
MEDNQSLLELKVDTEAASNLTEACRWGKLLAILALIAFGLVVIIVLALQSVIISQFFAIDELQESNSSLIVVTLVTAFLVAGVIVGILLSFLLKATNRIRNGIQNKDQLLFNQGLASLKSYFIMYGIISIIGLVFTLFSFLNN